MSEKYEVVETAVASVDCYSGPKCDEIAEGDWMAEVEKEGNVSVGRLLELAREHFPAGTRVLIEEPMCAECELCRSACEEIGEPCKARWEEWDFEHFG